MHGKLNEIGDALPGLSTLFTLLAAALGLYVAHQSGLTVWLPLYMEQELGAGPWLATSGVSMLWVGIVLGRFSASVVLRRFKPGQLLVVDGGADRSPRARARGFEHGGALFQRGIMCGQSRSLVGQSAQALIAVRRHLHASSPNSNLSN